MNHARFSFSNWMENQEQLLEVTNAVATTYLSEEGKRVMEELSRTAYTNCSV